MRVPPGSVVTATVGADALLHGGRFTLQRKVGSAWRTVRGGTLSAAGFSTKVVVPKAGTGAFRLRVTGTERAVPVEPVISANTLVTLKGIGNPKAYEFLYPERGGGAARWDPCQPIHWRFNRGTAPAWVVVDAKEALRRISLVTGIRFVQEGCSKVVLRKGVPVYLTGLPRRQEFVVGWYSAGEAGFFGELAYASTLVMGDRIIGQGVAVDRSILRTYRPGFGAGRSHGAVLLHEFAHLLGLDHVGAPGQLMRPADDGAGKFAWFGAGDLAGLRKIGRAAGCNPTAG